MFVVPTISKQKKLKNCSRFEMTDYCDLVIASVDRLDVEGNVEAYQDIAAVLRGLEMGAQARILSVVDYADTRSLAGIREDELRSIGSRTEYNYICFEQKANPLKFLQDAAKSLFNKSAPKENESDGIHIDLFRELRRMNPRALEEDDVVRLFVTEGTTLESSRSGITNGKEWMGFVRLYRPSWLDVELETLASVKTYLPAGSQISLTLTKKSSVGVEFDIKRRLSQAKQSNDLNVVDRAGDLAAIESDLQKSSTCVFNAEFIVKVVSSSKEALARDLASTVKWLRPLGDATIETFGKVNALLASQPGGVQGESFGLLELETREYLPIFSYSKPEVARAETSLGFHRRDGSITYFDLFDRERSSNNIIINGNTGSGKSVLANLLTSALISDPKVDIVKIDVGGSYRKECELANGLECSFDISEPSRLDPLRAIPLEGVEQGHLSIVVDLVETLLLDGEEKSLLRSERAQLEEQIELIIRSGCREMVALLRKLELPERNAVISRWTEGVLKNTFLGTPRNLANKNYLYYNFKDLQNATSPDYVRAIFASVIAELNLRLSSADKAGRKIALIIDESPFFVEHSRRFFKLTTANFRKFGHITILISQQFSDFEGVTESGTPDLGILNNSMVRFIHNTEGRVEEFAEKLQLDIQGLQKIESLYRARDYREVLLQTEHETKVLQVRLTPEEYLRVSSSREDNEKINNLRTAVPGLKLEEALKCLSVQ